MASRQADDPGRNETRASASAALAALTRRAAAALVFERLWPRLAWAGALIALFLALSWLGLWLALPRAGRIVGVAALAALFVAALAPIARLKRPTREETLARVDREAEAPHHPAASFADRLAVDHGDELTEALWRLHRDRLARQVAAIRPALPSPRMALRDPRALRFAALILAFAAAIVAGPERYGRLAAAFDWRGAFPAAATARLDAWIDPPGYTGKPPVMLDVAAKRAPGDRIVVPEGSILALRADPATIGARVEGGLAPAPADAAAKTPPAPNERRWTIKGDGAFALTRDGAPLARFDIGVIPGGKPTIALTEPPRANLSGSLTLHYAVGDRYGVAGAEAEFARPNGAGGAPAARSLMPPPKLPLQLPSAANGVGEATTTSDLSEHPWAGASATMTLKATGVSGETGASAPVVVTLPQRAFHNPLARALVEQRRDLILDPDHDPPRLARALAALTIAPDAFQTPAGVYLGLRDVAARLARAQGDADLVAVADLLWAMATEIEDGDASQAQRDLRAAEQKLREALQRGASDEEIRALTQQLRDAAERYLRDLAEQAPPAGADAEPMVEQDLDSLLDRLEGAARSGARQDAEAMLDRLQGMFENLRSARQAEGPAERALRKQIGELEKLLRDQQALRDDTFRRDQRERSRRDAPPPGAAPPDSGDDQQADQSLEQRQRALRDRLEALRRQLKALGMKGEKGFDEAEGAMKEAEGDLSGQGDQGAQGEGLQGQGQPGGEDDFGEAQGGETGKGRAVEAQGRALEALRQGAEGMAQQMRGGGPGGYVAAGRRPGDPRLGRDPLGRQRGDQGGALEGSLNGGADVAERARRVLEELRRRLADPNRPQDERDYLERLLRRD